MSGEAAPQTVDVLVIGGGSAALCAAIAARRAGASVRLIEQAPRALRGGNTRHARNFRLAHDGPTPCVPGEYGEEAFFRDLVRVTRGATDERLARLLIRGSATIAAWLEGNGVHLQERRHGRLPYSRRTAFFLGGGKAMVNALYATAAGLGVAIDYDSEVVGLDFDDDRACAVSIHHDRAIERVGAGAVVACAGGHQANLDWLRRDIGAAADGFMVRGTPYATGSVLRLLLDAGVKPAGNPCRCHLVAVDARGPEFDGGIVTRITAIPHGIVVDRNGLRFHDEREDVGRTHYARWGARIAERPDQIAFLIMDANGLARALPTALLPVQADSVAMLAAKLQLDPIALQGTVRSFNHAVTTRGEFSPIDCRTIGTVVRTSHAAAPLVVAPFACYPLRPGITFTHFGVAVDDRMRVVRNDGSAADGMFAAGMIMAANVLGEGYLAGLGVTMTTVFGRLAGEAAAQHAGR
jgi:tricarballylate dehydrogenase